jgi:hypothetical protein
MERKKKGNECKIQICFPDGDLEFVKPKDVGRHHMNINYTTTGNNHNQLQHQIVNTIDYSSKLNNMYLQKEKARQQILKVGPCEILYLSM